MTPRQIRWAAQHDWFLFEEGVPTTGLIAVCRDVYHDGEEWREATVRFDSFAELRAWAGY